MSMRRRLIVGMLALAAAIVVAGLLWTARDRAGNLLPWPAFEIGKELSTVPGVSIKAAFDGIGGGLARYASTQATLTAQSATFRSLLTYAYSIPKGGIAWEVEPPEGVFDVSAEVSTGADELKKRLREALEQAFRIRATFESRDASVLVLKRSEKHRGALQIVTVEEEQSAEESRGSYQQQGPVVQLAEWLEKRLRVPILDETGVTEDIRVSLSWREGSSPSAVFESLEQNGLSLEKANRTVETLVISR